jgi:hypothetical protein
MVDLLGYIFLTTCRYILPGSDRHQPIPALFYPIAQVFGLLHAQPVLLSQKVSVLGDGELFGDHFSHDESLHLVRFGRRQPVPAHFYPITPDLGLLHAQQVLLS